MLPTTLFSTHTNSARHRNFPIIGRIAHAWLQRITGVLRCQRVTLIESVYHFMFFDRTPLVPILFFRTLKFMLRKPLIITDFSAFLTLFSLQVGQMMRIIEVLGMPPRGLLDKTRRWHVFFDRTLDRNYIPKVSLLVHF